MTAEEGFENAMREQMKATLSGDNKRAEKARKMVQYFKNLMDRKNFN